MTGALNGIRVLDVSTIVAGPMAATILGDYGADVIKVEHPSGDGQRAVGFQKNGESLWWKFLGRNKRSITLDLHEPGCQRILRQLAAKADVLIENFRPGTLDRWDLGFDSLKSANPRLVMLSVTGFGQTGPYAARPGFGTLAEAMTGYAHMNGYPDGPPTLPPFALGDAVAAVFGAASVLAALLAMKQGNTSTGQQIDLSIYEPLFWILGPQALVYDQLGLVQERTGNSAPFVAPRNAYLCADGRWIVLSATTQSVAERLMRLIGAERVAQEEWFANHEGRLQHQALLDDLISKWVKERTAAEVTELADRAEVAMGPVYSIAEIFKDPQYAARDTVTTVADPDLGPIRMQNVVPRMLGTPAAIRRPAPHLGQHNREILIDELGYSEAELMALGIPV